MRLTINKFPSSASVVVKKKGQESPLSSFENLDAGMYVVEASDTGKISKKRIIEIGDTDTTIDIVLIDTVKKLLNITTDPPDATILIKKNNSSGEVVSNNTQVNPGVYWVSIQKDEYFYEEFTIIMEGREYVRNIDLRKITQPSSPLEYELKIDKIYEEDVVKVYNYGQSTTVDTLTNVPKGKYTVVLNGKFGDETRVVHVDGDEKTILVPIRAYYPFAAMKINCNEELPIVNISNLDNGDEFTMDDKFITDGTYSISIGKYGFSTEVYDKDVYNNDLFINCTLSPVETRKLDLTVLPGSTIKLIHKSTGHEVYNQRVGE